MAYISNKERESLIKKINKSYGLRKVLMIIELVLLIGFIVMTFVSLVLYGNDNTNFAWWNDSTKNFTTLGGIMLAWAIVEGLLGIIVLILILTLKSPKKVTQQINKLESSALSGKKVKKTETSSDVYKTRTTVQEDKKNKKNKK